MNIEDIKQAGTAVLSMLSDYRGREQGELAADRVLYGYFQGKFGNMTRQHQVAAGRIDFRYGSSNPVVIEFVLRSAHDPAAKLFASQNRSELHKLTRVRPSTARTRVLLLLDRSQHPIPRVDLMKSYVAEHTGVGRFERHSVRLIYVHRTMAYSLSWRPRRP